MMRPPFVVFAGASAPSTFLRLLLSLLMLAMFVLGGQALAQEASSEATPMRAPPPPEEGDPPYNYASMIIQSVPSEMVIGRLYDVSISMRNTGTTTWYGATGHRLGSASPMDNMTWGLSRVELPTSQTGPGNTATFNFQVRAPSAPGTYTFQWQMLQEGFEWFGPATYPITVTVREPVNNAEPTGQTVPAQMEAGRPYTVSVSVINNGETTWTRAQNYTLMAQSPHNTMTWGLNRVALPVDNIAPGQSTTFTFQVTAPGIAGSYAFQWGMQREGYGSFGPGTTPVMVNVVAPPPLVNNAQVVGMTAPNRMITGQRYDVAVAMRNTGTTTWAPGSNQLLGSQNPQDNGIWGLGRVPLPVAVAPGQQYTFVFQVTAPAPGDYNMQWRMLQEAVEWFGATAGSPVNVTENLGNVTFIHTDGLGSPVARTDATGNLISRTRYEPYGYTASGATPAIGFTGHVNDADTGLTYMQQRYYDPVAGRFLSIDPVVTDANTGSSFNRYSYANNNPTKYIDPDGRFSKQACGDMAGNCTNYGSLTSDSRATDSVNRTSAQYHFEMMGKAIEEVGEWYLTGLTLAVPEITAARAVPFVGLTGAEIVAVNRSVGGTMMLTGNVETVIANASYYSSKLQKIAVHIRDIAGRHLFDDGNKRTAQIVAEKLGSKNGVPLDSAKVRVVIDSVARGEARTVEDIASKLGGK